MTFSLMMMMTMMIAMIVMIHVGAGRLIFAFGFCIYVAA